MTTASPDQQLALLELQAVDTHLDQIEHRLSTLPERASVAEADAALVDLRDLLVAAETEVGDLERAVRKAEAEVETVRTRAARDNELLLSGTITSSKQLEELQHEVGSLARRQDDLETAELEVMELLDGAKANRDDLASRIAGIEAAREQAAAALSSAESVGADERTQARAEREGIAPRVPADLLALYEKLRAEHGGIGAARVHRGRCEGCRIELTPSDVGRIRAAAADEVLRCEECRRILVRTNESGL